MPDPMPFGRRVAAPPGPDAGAIELGLIFAGLRRNKWLILLCIVAAGALAAFSLRSVNPSYDSFSEVLLETRLERVVGIEQVVSDLAVTNSVVAGEIAVLQSNLLIGRVVDKLNLLDHPEYDPYRIVAPSLFQRLSNAVSGQVSAWRGVEAEPMPTVEAEDGLSANDARNLVIWQVKRNLKVGQSGIAFVIGIAVRASDPDIAAQIANAVAEQYINDQLSIKQSATQRAIIWLDNRLQELETQLRNAEDAVVDFLAELSLGEGGNDTSVEQQLSELNRSYVISRAEHAVAAAKLDHIRGMIARGGPDLAAVALDSPRLLALDKESAELERQRAQLGQRLGDLHPEMIALNSAIDDLARDRLAAIDSAIGAIEVEVALASEREDSVERNITAAHQRLVELSRSSVRLRQLERSASAMRQVYETFLARFQETTQQLEFQRADARIITQGEPALSPSRPRKTLIMALALFMGAVAGVGLSLVYEVMNRPVRDGADLLRVTNLPVLTTLPRVRRRGRRGAWQLAELRRAKLSPYAEGLRMLRATLLSTRSPSRPRVVMFSGVEAGAGASTTALGLARVVAALGTRVALVDANLRRPTLHVLAGLLPAGPDLVDLIHGRAGLDMVAAKDPESSVTIVPAWRGQQNAADLVASADLRRVIEDLAGRFDLVILDAPPAIGVADAKVLAELADTSVVVARAGTSRESRVAAAVTALDEAAGNVGGTVLSQAPRGEAWATSVGPLIPSFETAG